MTDPLPEFQSPEARAADQLARLNAILGPDQALSSLDDLARLPVLRKSDLVRLQSENPPLGGVKTGAVTRLFQSPGPIYEPGGSGHDWWRFGAFLRATGIGAGDIVQNTFAYHFTPAGAMFENAAISAGAQVFAAGPGQSAEQARVAAHIGTTTYAGTPDFLAVILEKADELGLDLSRLTKAAVSAGPLFPQMRADYAARGVTTRQCYATADVGMIAYESDALEGLIVDDGCIVEIVTPGTGDRLPDGEIGEVLVTVLNPDYPLIRFATGDLSAVMPGTSPCGRTNMRIVGWRGRADQSTKVRGMFIRPEQVAAIVAAHDAVGKARVEVSNEGGADRIVVRVETTAEDLSAIAATVREVIKLRAEVVAEVPGSLPNDGIVVEDKRSLDG
ncbi:MAG: phenylacetate--CoA ligase family protein [Alphaproteobacteria bacterium]|nr:MAG: phenylacetate--CoA ligase family protein [Alphaproteobacteria bacterium]